MQTKDVIFQVSEETAGLMQELSDQLFDDTQEQLDEIKDQISGLYTNDQAKKDRGDFLQGVNDLANTMTQIQNEQGNVMMKLIRDNNGEKLDCVLRLLAETGQTIQRGATGIEDTVQLVGSCNVAVNELRFSVKELDHDNSVLRDNITTMLAAGEKYTANSFGKLDQILLHLDALTRSVQVISEQQENILQQQAALEKNVEYLKLPFYKRWFRKGR